ncbi:MAG: 23S rRNA pseudouridine(1911/1915/1917) synthase RluD [Endozoicomonas sp. (ex Botrylloides leachii)]|nr:23S rRNA pseudouridine(1911/1915/1917) synthase RluD [Endozoicomonas sp. (ex Botrylloides leachii)]
MAEIIKQISRVPEALAGFRLDHIAVKCFPDYSRSKLQTWIKQGVLQVDGQVYKNKDKLFGGETLSLNVEIEHEDRWEAENISLHVIYEDEHILVINKPAGLVVHPAAGNYSGTLLNGLLYHYPELASVPRAGIVHRLDKNTTGLMVVAKTLSAHSHLAAQLQQRTISRDYEAVTQGVITSGGTINQPIGRHPTHRLKMAVVEGGKPSITHYIVHTRYRSHTHIQVSLETGRTHQIRVHMAYIRYPLIGDTLYAGRLQIPKACSDSLAKELQYFNRQALHACRLGLIHPTMNSMMTWEAPRPEDFQQLLQALQDNQDGK